MARAKVSRPKEVAPSPRKRVPLRPSVVKSASDYHDINKIILDGAEIGADITDALTSATIDRTMDGASTLVLTVHDFGRKLIDSKMFNSKVEAQVDDLFFTLVKVAKSGHEFTCTFEDREVEWLRRYTTPRKVSRDQVTRAQFIKMLIDEVKEGVIGFHCPELKDKQPIAAGDSSAPASPSPASTPSPATSKAPGFGSASVTVKHVRADATQKSNLARILAVGVSLKAPKNVLIAAVACVTQEDSARNGSGGGMFQQNPDWPGDAYNIENAATNFYSRAPTAPGGAIGVYKRSPGSGIASIIQTVQRAGVATHGQWVPEATKTVAAYMGGSGGSDGGGGLSTDTTTVTKPYEFARGGQDGKPEDSWTCIQRLAAEVGWHAFMVAGTLYYISDPRLMMSGPMTTVGEDDDGVDWIDWDWDVGRVLAEGSIVCRAKRWQAPPGTVIELEQCGPADGRWLVNTISGSLFSSDVKIKTAKAQPKLPEPAPQTETQASVSGSPGGGLGAGVGGSPLSFRGKTFTGPGNIVAIGHFLQSVGYHVEEHPLFGGVHPVHHHYGYYDHYNGGALDVTGPDLTGLAVWLAKNKKRLGIPTSGMPNLGGRYGSGVMWQVVGHFDHLHVSAHHG